MPSWKKIITSGSSASLSSLTVTNNVTATSLTGSLNIPAGSTLGVGAQTFYPQGLDGFSVNENFNVGSAVQTAYHFTSGNSARPSVVFSLARTANFTNMFGVTGSAANNKFVFGAEFGNTDFEWRKSLGVTPVQLQGGTLLASLSRNGNFYALGGFTGSLQGTASYASNSDLLDGLQATSFVLTTQTSSMSVASASVATSASYALTASFALNGGGGAAFPFSGSAVITGSLQVTAGITGSLYSPKTTTDGSTITSTTANTLAGSVLVPANTFAAGDFIRVFARVKKTTTISSTRIRLYVNTSNSLSGATQIADSNAGQFLQIASLERTFMVKNVTTDTEGLEVAAIAFTDVDISGTTLQGFTVESHAIDWTVDQFVIVAVQPNAFTESQTFSGMYVQKI